MLIAEFGWAWEYIDDEMTLPRLFAIQDRWRNVPPLSSVVHAIAVGLGVIKDAPTAAPEQAANDADMGDLVRLVGGVTERMPEWLQAGLATT